MRERDTFGVHTSERFREPTFGNPRVQMFWAELLEDALEFREVRSAIVKIARMLRMCGPKVRIPTVMLVRRRHSLKRVKKGVTTFGPKNSCKSQSHAALPNSTLDDASAWKGVAALKLDQEADVF
jgi:hypothetical protein